MTHTTTYQRIILAIMMILPALGIQGAKIKFEPDTTRVLRNPLQYARPVCKGS